MKTGKSRLNIILILLFTAILGGVAYFSSQLLTKTTPVAPNVAQVTPKAAVSNCTLAFSITPPTGTPTHTPTNTPTGTPSSTPSRTPTPTNTPTNTPTETPTGTPPPTSTPTRTPTPTSTATPTPTTPPACNSTCTVNSDCPTNMVCSESACRNPSCTEQASCSCPATPTPTPTTVVLTATPTPTTAIVYAGCNSACTVNTDCASGLVCVDSACRNASCTEKTTCSCDVAVVPQTPIAGTGPSVLGASVITIGALLLLFGLAF